MYVVRTYLHDETNHGNRKKNRLALVYDNDIGGVVQ